MRTNLDSKTWAHLLEGSSRPELSLANVGPSALDVVMAGLSRLFRGIGDVAPESRRDWTRERLSEILSGFVPYRISQASHFEIAVHGLRSHLASRISRCDLAASEDSADDAALSEAVERLDYLFRLEPLLNYRFVVEQHLVDVAGVAAPRICDLTIIEEALRSPHPAIRGSALRALGNLAITSEPYMNGERVHKAGASILRVRRNAIEALHRLAESTESSDELATLVLPSLCKFRHSAVPYLLRLLGSNRSSAVEVIDALGRLGDVARGAVSSLTTELAHPDLPRRLAAGRALLSIGEEWPETMEKVAEIASAPGGGALKELIEARLA